MTRQGSRRSMALRALTLARDILVPLVVAVCLVALARWWGYDLGPPLAE